MEDVRTVDVTFNFTSDTPPGKDPDLHSPTLRKYHRLLWSKPLPSGGALSLEPSKRAYLQHQDTHGMRQFASDAVIPEFTRATAMREIVDQLDPESIRAFHALGYTIGGMMIWPADRRAGKMTINGARGFHPRIRDRSDLTIECVKRFYVGEASPLTPTLERYADFFGLFRDFDGFVSFFLLDDIIDPRKGDVRAFLPHNDFSRSAFPLTLAEYEAYRGAATDFLHSRNARIARWTQSEAA